MGSQYSGDRVSERARREGYRSRAAYKLKEILHKYNIIRDTDSVVDLGAAPGSWLQVLSGITNGVVIGIDINPIAPLPGVLTITGDFTDPKIKEKVLEQTPVVSCIVCDASPHLSGQKSYDQARAIALNEDALAFASGILKSGGNMILKSFQGEDFPALLQLMREQFYSVKTFKAKTSRKGSTEIYIIAKYYTGETGSNGPV